MEMMKKLFVLVAWLIAGSLMLGAVWTQKRLTNNAGNSAYPDIAVNGSNVYVVWCDYTPGNWDIYFRRSTDSGLTWQSAKRLTYNAADCWFPEVAVSGANVYVVWYDDSSGNEEIYFKRSLDNGATWQATQRLTTNSGGSAFPAIAASGANVYVVWEDNTQGNADIYFKKSANGGATWHTAKMLTTNAGSSCLPQIAANGANTYVVWHDLTPGNAEIYFKKSADSGTTWQTAKRLTNNAGTSDYVDLTVSGSNIFVVWNDDTPGNFEIFSMKSDDGGSTWESWQQQTNDPEVSYCPTIAASGSTVYLVWYDLAPGNWEVYLKKSIDSGGSWPSPQRFTNNTGASLYPHIAVSAAKAYVVWEDSTPGDSEIYLKHSPL